MTAYRVRIRHTMYFDVQLEDGEADSKDEAEALAWDIWDNDLTNPAEELSTCEYVEVVADAQTS